MNGIGVEHAGTASTLTLTGGRWIWSRRGFLVVSAVYCALHFVLRLVLTPTLGVDDIDQAIFAQQFAWGYEINQPPLFTWLMLGLYKTLGVSLLAHALLKYTLLFAVFVFLYLGARALVSDPKLAVMAGLSPLLMNHLAIGVHQGFTHSVLLSACIAAAFWVTVRWVRRGATADYWAMGLIHGLGLLSKYNFAIYLMGALAAGLTIPEVRRRLRDGRLLITVLVGLVVVAPEAWWMVHNLTAPTQDWSLPSPATPGRTFLGGVWAGLITSAVGAVDFLLPLWILLLVFFPRAWRWRLAGEAGAARWRRFLGAQMLWGAGLVVLAVAVFQIGFVKGRWLHPVLLLFPIFIALRIQAAGYRASAPRRMLYAMGMVSLVVIALRIGQIHVGPYFDTFGRFHQPFPELARQIEAVGFDGGTIVAADDHIAGNFRLVFPESRILTPMYPFWVPRPVAARGDCLLVWYADAGARPPEALRDFARTRLDIALPGAAGGPGQRGMVERPVRHSTERSLALGFWLVPEARGCGR